MIAISTTELRKNLRKYLNLANKERVIIQCGNAETYEIVPGNKISDRDDYFSDLKLLAALKEAEEDIAAGRFTDIKDPQNIWESIL
jgi:PHD/YefM family antitoxin component YafN of YafNO toxin-antitoxin module